VKPLKKYFSLPVFLSNDCSAAVSAEKYFGAGRKSSNFVYLTISSGIGSGIIADNYLLSGHNNSAGEVGHFIVDTIYNLPCQCQKGHGHWEAYCSGNNMPVFLKTWLKSEKIKNNYSAKTSMDIFDLAKNKDKNILNFLKKIKVLLSAHVYRKHLQSISFLNFSFKVLLCASERQPSFAITLSFLTVTILSTFMTDRTRKPLRDSGSISISLLLRFFDTTDEMADTIISSYLSAVVAITTAGLTLIFVNSAKGNGNSITSPVFIAFFSFPQDNPDKYLHCYHSKNQMRQPVLKNLLY
ncbi:MAG: ROK family protein, partial [Proteobacteria bacterium]|nr:ROK family protein [Pseudomonadota bacterium]